MRETHSRPEHLSDPGKAARRSAGIPVVPAFDGYRALAIMAVVMLHVSVVSGLAAPGVHDFPSRVVWGTLGHAVELLFIVSGFVVFLPTVARGGRFGDLKSFAIRRAARLLPAFWLILLISIPVVAVFEPPNTQMPDLRDLILNFTGLVIPVGMFAPGASLGFGLNPPLWTLSVEICFYLVLPLIAGAFFRKPWVGLAISALLTIGWTIAFDHVARTMDLLGFSPDLNELVRLQYSAALQLPTWAYSFGLGMFGAWAWIRLQPGNRAGTDAKKRGRTIKGTVVVSILALLVVAWLLGGGYDDTRRWLAVSLAFSTLVAILMVSLALAPESWQRPVAFPGIRRLGDISYGIYLSHMVIAYVLLDELSLPVEGNLYSLLVWTLAVVPAAVLYGYLSARFVEQPIRRWARRYGRQGDGDAGGHTP